jgi:hypothetical protein
VDKFVGLAKLQLGADTEAVAWLRRSIDANRNSPVTHFALAAALGLQGSLDEARAAAMAGLALNPTFTIRRLQASQPSDNSIYLAGRERLYMGLRLAGVPEGDVCCGSRLCENAPQPVICREDSMTRFVVGDDRS